MIVSMTTTEIKDKWRKHRVQDSLPSSYILCQAPSVGILTIYVLGAQLVKLILSQLSWWTEVKFTTKPVDGA